MGNVENVLKELIQEIREAKDYELIEGDRESYEEGLATAAMFIAEKLDEETDFENEYLEHEGEWWNGDIDESVFYEKPECE